MESMYLSLLCILFISVTALSVISLFVEERNPSLDLTDPIRNKGGLRLYFHNGYRVVGTEEALVGAHVCIHGVSLDEDCDVCEQEFPGVD